MTVPLGMQTPVDGRRQRSRDSRERIVAAMLELIEAGHLSPSAEQVSERAGVGLRSVFRHFQDMETLHRQVSETLGVRFAAIAREPFKARDWQGQLMELVERRTHTYEAMGPFLRAGQVHRHGSAVLAEGHAAFVAALRAILVERLPAGVARDRAFVEAVDLLLSFEAWQRLRDDQGLSVAKARATLTLALRALLAQREAR